MRKLYPLIALIAFATASCNKEYSGWNVYYNSKIKLVDMPAGAECASGGVLIQSGLDKNQNDVLDSAEIDNSEIVCNGTDSRPSEPGESGPKQIIIQLDMLTANTHSSTPQIVGSLPFFSKSNYPGYDSIVLVGRPYIGPPGGNSAIVELYDLTNDRTIADSRVTGAKEFTETQFAMSKNIYSALPEEEISLGSKMSSSHDGMFAGTGPLYLYLYRK